MATVMDKAKKLTADLTHMEAEKVRLGRHCETLKVHMSLRMLDAHATHPMPHAQRCFVPHSRADMANPAAMRQAIIGAKRVSSQSSNRLFTPAIVQRNGVLHLSGQLDWRHKQSSPH